MRNGAGYETELLKKRRSRLSRTRANGCAVPGSCCVAAHVPLSRRFGTQFPPKGCRELTRQSPIVFASTLRAIGQSTDGPRE